MRPVGCSCRSGKWSDAVWPTLCRRLALDGLTRTVVPLSMHFAPSECSFLFTELEDSNIEVEIRYRGTNDCPPFHLSRQLLFKGRYYGIGSIRTNNDSLNGLCRTDTLVALAWCFTDVGTSCILCCNALSSSVWWREFEFTSRRCSLFGGFRSS